MTGSPTADQTSPEPRASSEAQRVAASGTTAERVPLAPLTLAPVPGLQAVGGDAVGFCGPDGCYPAAGSSD
jgi:hypothetical protein